MLGKFARNKWDGSESRPYLKSNFLIVWLIFLPLLAHAEDDAQIRDLLRQRIDVEKRGVSIVVGLIDEKGTRVISYGRGANAQTIFEIGSISKVFTATLLAQAVERGDMKLDDPVEKYISSEARLPKRGGKPITFLDLATHRSGLPRMPDNMHPANPADPYVDYTPAQLWAFLLGHNLTRDIGSQYEYSNLGAALLGRVIAARANSDYEQILVRDICRPFGMKNTSTRLATTAAPHDERLTKVSNWDLGIFAGAGGIRSNVDDMLKFLAANMDEKGAMKMTHEVRNNAGSPTMDIGLGWHINKAHPPALHWHNGGTGGYRSFIGFDLKRHRGVVVLSNSANSVDDIGFHMLNAEYPLAGASKKPPVLKREILDRYVGRYEIAPSFVLTFSREGEHVYLQATGQGKNELTADSETEFSVPGADIKVAFVKNAAGVFDSMTLIQRGRGVPDQVGKRLP